jgi:hypothetical protein
MPCVKCSNGDVQCGEDASDLCQGSGGWTKAGALCLEFRTRIVNGKVVLKIELHPQDDCGGQDVIYLEQPIKKVIPKKTTKGRKK